MQLSLKHIIAAIILAVLLVCRPQGLGLASDSQSHVFTGKVNANNINVRVDATTGAPVACTLDKGQPVEVVREAYDWYKIRLPKTAPSYIKKNLVECIDRVTSPSEPVKCLNAKVIGEKVNIRLGPGEDSWIMGKADKLSVVNILEDQGTWYKIEPVHQSFGWVHKKFVDKAVAPAVPVAALASGSQTAALRPALPLQPVVVEGTVSPYGVVLWRQATHKLITAENKIYFLKSNRKGLDSLNYHRVKVTGKLITPPDSKHPIIQVAVIEALN